MTFSVTNYKNENLIITSNTYWECNVYGNFRLSKYNGSGGDTINIIVPGDLSFSYGKVIFSYGGNKCDYPTINIFKSK